MKNPKILALLIAIMLFVNYNNYLLPNRDKKAQEIHLLEKKIAKEKKLNNQKVDIKRLALSYEKLFFDKKYNYSQAMGEFQNIITKSAQETCKITHIKWAQVPVSLQWYDKLKINLSLTCTPKNIFVFMNKLRANPELFIVDNSKIFVDKKKKKLKINMQLTAYRMHDEK